MDSKAIDAPTLREETPWSRDRALGSGWYTCNGKVPTTYGPVRVESLGMECNYIKKDVVSSLKERA